MTASEMLRFVLVALFVACACAASVDNVSRRKTVSSPTGNSFRRDYYYYVSAEGWIKQHNPSSNWLNARLTCRLEGARLASPINAGMSSTLQELIAESPHESVFLGIQALGNSTDFFSIEGQHILRMPLEWDNQPEKTNQKTRCLAMARNGHVFETSCDDEKPFFCYKPYADIRMNICGTSDPGYVRNVQTGSCYKVHREPQMTWYKAHTTCAAEGARLVVINSDVEAEILGNMVQGLARDIAVGLHSWWRDDGFDQSVWMTVDGHTPEEAGFSRWQPGEPNNQGDEWCGAIGWNRNIVGYNDINCNTVMPFICEVERSVIAVPT